MYMSRYVCVCLCVVVGKGGDVESEPSGAKHHNSCWASKQEDVRSVQCKKILREVILKKGSVSPYMMLHRVPGDCHHTNRPLVTISLIIPFDAVCMSSHFYGILSKRPHKSLCVYLL